MGFSRFFNSSRKLTQEGLQTLLLAFVEAKSLNEKQRILEDHPELFSDESDAMLSKLARIQNHQSNKEIIQYFQRLVGECKESGIRETLIKEQHLQIIWTLLCAQSISDAKAIIQSHPELLSVQAERYLKDYLDVAEKSGDQNLIQSVKQTRNLLRRCRELGVEPAFNSILFPNDKNNAIKINTILGALAQPKTPDQLYYRIKLCQEALELLSQENYPDSWALVNLELGYDFTDISDPAVQSAEKAIYHFRNALLVYTLFKNPKKWADAHYGLGNCFNQLEEDANLAESIEHAIDHYEQALRVYNPIDYPNNWASAKTNIGVALRKRIKGARKDNIEKALLCNEESLQVYSQKDFPSEWALVQNSIGNIYSERINGEKAENIEKAIEYYQKALDVFIVGLYPSNWAMVQNNLGNTFMERIKGDRAENIEKAITFYEQALIVYTKNDFPSDWAEIKNNLGTAYLDRLYGDISENIEQAIDLFMSALDVHTFDQHPKNWADDQNNLGASFLKRSTGDKEENIKKAILYFENVLKFYKEETFPEHWAGVQNLLGLSCSQLLENGKIENNDKYFRGSVSHYTQALRVFTYQGFPEQWAGIQSNLANVYKAFASSDQVEYIEKSIFYYQQALKIYTPSRFPEQCHKVAQSLGHLAFGQELWRLAINAYEQSLQSHQFLRQASLSLVRKQQAIEEIKTLPRYLAYAYFRMDQLKHSVETLEQAHAQLMREVFERQRTDLQFLPELGFTNLLERFNFAAQEENFLLSLPPEMRTSDWLVKIEHNRAEVETVADAIRRQAGAKYSQYRFFLKSLPFDDIQAQAQDAPLIYLATTKHGGVALIVYKQGEPQVVSLPSLTDDALHKQVLDHFIDYFENNNWFHRLEETLLWIGHEVMTPILTALNGCPNAVLIPGGLLGLLPLHAAIVSQQLETRNLKSEFSHQKKYALDLCNFTYAPSAQALYHARFNTERQVQTLLAVDNPDGSLPFTEAEVNSVLEHFPDAKHLLREQATKEAVLEAIPAANILHFSTHGKAGWDIAENARLKLANSDLTMPELSKLNLMHARLAVLSACETGVSGTKLPDEVQSLPSAFMQAGVPGVIGSMWSVSDMSTAILMARFYDLWRDGKLSAPKALRQAQTWLRDSTALELKNTFDLAMKATGMRISAASADAFYKRIVLDDPESHPFAHPFYWAAFTYTGL